MFLGFQCKSNEFKNIGKDLADFKIMWYGKRYIWAYWNLKKNMRRNSGINPDGEIELEYGQSDYKRLYSWH